MSYGNYGQHEGAPKRGGSGIMFLVMLFIGGFIMMNFLQQPGNVNPGESIPDRSTERGGYERSDYDRNQANPIGQVESKGGIYGAEQAERPATHPDASDWDMDTDIVKQPNTPATTGGKSKRTERGDWAMEETPVGDRKNKKPSFNLSNPTDDSKPVSKSTTNGDWVGEEVDVDKK